MSMVKDLNRTENGGSTSSRLHAHKFAMWIGLASITMMFVALTSAYIVRKSAGNWLEFNRPWMFIVSTVVIILSTLTLHLPYKSFLSGKASAYRNFVV